MANFSSFLKTKLITFALIFVVVATFGAVQIQKASSEQPILKDYYILPVEGVNFRSDPYIYSKVLSTIPYGTRLGVEMDLAGWSLTNFEGKEGWVRTEYLTDQPPVELSVKNLLAKDLIDFDQSTESLSQPEYRDYNGDGFLDVLFMVIKDGSSNAKEFYIYGYENGYVLTKYLEVSPKNNINLYSPQYRGGESLSLIDGKLILGYPLYFESDGLCCPSGGQKEVELKI